MSLRSLMRKGSGADRTAGSPARTPARWGACGPRDEHAPLDKIARQEAAKQQRDAEREARRADARAAKERAAEERERRKQDEQARRDAERRAQEEFEAQAFQHYQRVREWAARMRSAADPAIALTDTEHATLAALAPMWDATPQMIATLRRCCEPVSGVRASDYESRDSDMAKDLKRQIGFLRKQLGPELFVPESSILGGFGFVDQGALYNQDTVTSFYSLVALQDAAVLQAFSGGAASRQPTGHSAPRHVVWEIGGGWGGFAYQFKRVCPNVTYVITGHPDLFLLSAVYLMSAFPDARVCFLGHGPAEAGPHKENVGSAFRRTFELDDIDFVFAPESAVPTLGLPRLDLTIDRMALQAKTCTRAAKHVERAFELGSRYFYTMNRIEAGLTRPAVHEAMERYFWPHPVPPRRDPKLEGMRAATGVEADAEFSHLVGWKRILLPGQRPIPNSLTPEPTSNAH